MIDVSKDKVHSIISNLRIVTEIYKSDDKKKIKLLTGLLEIIKE